MTPPGDNLAFQEWSHYRLKVMDWENKGFEGLGESVEAAVRNLASWEAKVLWRRGLGTSRELRGCKLVIEHPNSNGKARTFEVLYTASSGQRNLIWIKQGFFDAKALDQFRRDFDGVDSRRSDHEK
jgi:hypothetical protein